MAPQDRAQGNGGTTLKFEILDESVVRSLAAFRGAGLVTSLFLDVDGRRRPSAEDVDNAVARLHRRARRAADQLGSHAVAGLEADLAAITGLLAGGVDRATVKGLAFFACTGDRLLRALELPVPVRDRVTLGSRADVRPLVEILDRARRYLVVLVDRQDSRLIHARLGRIEEQPGPTDPVERQVDTDVEVGSWERRHQEAALRHLRKVAAAIVHDVELNPVDAIIVGGSQEAMDGLVPLLPPALTGLIVPRSGLPVRAGRAELTGVISEVDALTEQVHQEAVLVDLRDRIGTGKGAAGLAATLEALADGRVATLIVKPGYVAVGARCPSCGHLGIGVHSCPRCGSITEVVDDVVDAAIDRALAQDATIEFCNSSGLDELGGVGAVERF